MSLLLISASRTFQSSFSRQRFIFPTCRFLSTPTNPNIHQAENQQLTSDYPSSRPRRRYRYYFLSIAAGALIGAAYTFRQSQKYEGLMPEYISNTELLERQAMETRPLPPPVTKHITFDSSSRENFPFKLTLYQYVTCPFCCKVRAYLNYNRIPYDIVEVNSVMRSETKWSIYKKVPIIVIENEQIQLNDSSVIISAIESYLRMPTTTFKNISKLYQSVIERDEKGKLAFNYPNKYFLVEPLLNDRLDPTKQVQTEKTKRDAIDNKTPSIIDNQSSKSFFGN
jgi:glutaredoxin